MPGQATRDTLKKKRGRLVALFIFEETQSMAMIAQLKANKKMQIHTKTIKTHLDIRGPHTIGHIGIQFFYGSCLNAFKMHPPATFKALYFESNIAVIK